LNRPVTDIDAFQGMDNLALAEGRVWIDKILMDRETNQGDAVAEGVSLQVSQVGPMPRVQRLLLGEVHLTMEDVHPFGAQGCSPLDHLVNGDLGVPEMPVGIRGDCQADAGLKRDHRTGLQRARSQGGSSSSHHQGTTSTKETAPAWVVVCN